LLAQELANLARGVALEHALALATLRIDRGVFERTHRQAPAPVKR
jgi:hypothetical protein